MWVVTREGSFWRNIGGTALALAKSLTGHPGLQAGELGGAGAGGFAAQ